MTVDSLLLGVDVTTTNAKAGLFSLDGTLIAADYADYPLDLDLETDAAEQDPTDWWTAAGKATREALGETATSNLAVVCFGGQGPTAVAVDELLNPVHPALTWLDTRTSRQVALLRQRATESLPSHAHLPKVMWLKKNRPDAYRATRWLSRAWDFVASRLVAAPIVTSSAGIAPWSEDLLLESELDKEKFPPLCRVGQEVGRVTEEAAKWTGLSAGLPVIGGTSDYYEGLLGTGSPHSGIACDYGGSTQGFNVCWDLPLEAEGLLSIPSLIKEQGYIGGPASSTGKAVDWWRTGVLNRPTSDWQILEKARRDPPGSERPSGTLGLAVSSSACLSITVMST